MKVSEILYGMVGVALVIPLIWQIPAYFKGPGYCKASDRLLMDGELVDAAADVLIANLRQELKALPIGDKLNAIEYKSRADFYDKQPDCCLGRGAKFRTFELAGRAYPESVKVNIFYKHDYDGAKPYRFAEVLVHQCGDKAEVLPEKTDLTPFPTGSPRRDPARTL